MSRTDVVYCLCSMIAAASALSGCGNDAGEGGADLSSSGATVPSQPTLVDTSANGSATPTGGTPSATSPAVDTSGGQPSPSATTEQPGTPSSSALPTAVAPDPQPTAPATDLTPQPSMEPTTVPPGAGGAPGAGGQTGVGGTGPGSSPGGATGAGGDVGAGGQGGPVQPSGDSCPADATFCSGFEGSDLPAGAVFKWFGDPATDWGTLFEVDTTEHFAGTSSLRVRKNAEANANTLYKMLAVPAGGSNFWARMYVRSDVELGQEGHNAYAAASENDDPNDGNRVEFADDVGLSFNASDDVRWPDGYGRQSTGGNNPYTLPANEWHCIELHFDGAGRVQTLYIAGEEVLVAEGYPASAMTFTVFKFGYLGYHNEADRGLWYDEVAVGPTRIGCQ